jgi:hypothetical protein
MMPSITAMHGANSYNIILASVKLDSRVYPSAKAELMAVALKKLPKRDNK